MFSFTSPYGKMWLQNSGVSPRLSSGASTPARYSLSQRRGRSEGFLSRNMATSSRRSYAQTMNRLTAEHGALLVGAVDGATLDAFTAAAWGTGAPATWNRHVATVRSFTAFARRRGWMTIDPAGVLERRTEPADRTTAIAASSLERHSLTSHGLGQAHALAAGFAGWRLSTSRHHDWRPARAGGDDGARV